MTSKEALQVLYNNLKSHMTKDNPMFDLEYEQIKNDLKFLEILKKYFYIKFNDEDWAKWVNIVGKNDYYRDGGIDCIASSDFLSDEDLEFLKEYFKEEK